MSKKITFTENLYILDDEALKKIYAGNDPTTVNVSLGDLEPG